MELVRIHTCEAPPVGSTETRLYITYNCWAACRKQGAVTTVLLQKGHVGSRVSLSAEVGMSGPKKNMQMIADSERY